MVKGLTLDQKPKQISVRENKMPKIDKKTIKKFPKTSSLKIFKFENSKNYYCSFYVGTHNATSGNYEKSLKTSNVNDATKLAKQEFEKYFIENKNEKKVFDFTRDVAKPYFRMRIKKYNNGTNENIGKREQQKYFNYMESYFKDIDYRSNEKLEDAIEHLVENLKMDNKTDNTISKYTTVLSNMFNYAIKHSVINFKPEFPKLTIINQQRPSYHNDELNIISKELYKKFDETNKSEFLEIKDYINLIRGAGFRPGLEPLRIKRFQYRFIEDKKNKENILAFTLFDTKTKPKHQLTTTPYFAKYVFPEILERHKNKNADDYLLFPNEKDRQKVYSRISKVFTKITKELDLYYRNGSTRPIYSIRHTFIKNQYAKNPANVEIIARQSNTSPKMMRKNYLDEDDIMLIEEHRKLYPKKKTS
jgi:hypothetical protein